MPVGRRHARGFSVVELVIVVVIIAIVGAIAVPRVSRGAAAAGESALTADLATMRRAVELYTAEHGGVPPKTAAGFVRAMLQFSDVNGKTSPVRTTTHIYGPYLRAIPPVPVGPNRGNTMVYQGKVLGTGIQGWHYDTRTGWIRANTKDTEVDSRGTPYNQY